MWIQFAFRHRTTHSRPGGDASVKAALTLQSYPLLRRISRQDRRPRVAHLRSHRTNLHRRFAGADSSAVYDAFVDRLLALARSARMGNPLELTTQVGPITTQPQYRKVL